MLEKVTISLSACSFIFMYKMMLKEVADMLSIVVEGQVVIQYAV